ncbi:MAG: hypothetical protein WCJ17_03160 [bacterium]
MRCMVGKSVVVLSILISGVAVFPGSLSARSAPKAVVSSRNAPKVVVPLFVKKPRLKVQYNFFVKVLTKQAPDIKIAFEKAFAWGFKPAKRSDADKKAETALLDALEADTKLAPVYKEAIFTFSEDMHPSPWGKIILGSVGGIAATAALVVAGMWYRDKRRVERERVERERVAAEQLQQAQAQRAQEELEIAQQQALRVERERAELERVERERVETEYMEQLELRMQETDEALRKQEESVRKSLADRKSAVLESLRDVVSQSQRDIEEYEVLNAALQLRSSELEAIEVLRKEEGEEGIVVAIPEDEVQISSELRALIQARNKARANAIESYQKAKTTEESSAKILREIDGAFEDIDILETQKHRSSSKYGVKISSDLLPLSEPRAVSRLTPAQLNDMKKLFGIASSANVAENSILVESRETAIWTAYCNDMASFMPPAKQDAIKKSFHEVRAYRDHSRGGWCNIKMWQDAQRALNKRIELVASDLTAAALGVLGKGISNLPEIPDIFYYLRTGATVPENKIVFFDADGVEVEGALLGSVEFDFLGRIANTRKAQKLTELADFLTHAPQVSVFPPATVVGAGSRAGVVGAGVGAGAPSGPGATDTSGAAAGRVG